MDTRLKVINGLVCAVLLAVLSVQVPVFAKSASAAADKSDKQRYIVVLDDMPLVSYDGRLVDTPERSTTASSFKATANKFTGASKLDVNSPESKQYLEFLDERFESFRGEAVLKLGRQLKPVHRYRNAVNGFAVDLSKSEMKVLRDMPRVRGIGFDEVQHIQTDSGPNWIGADKIYAGSVGYPATGGEGVVVGVFDTGINWDHASFADPGEGGGSGWDHENPFDSELGLCSQPEVLCNDKLVGVYDLVEPEEGHEETNNGNDNVGHGSHVSSVVAGNPTNVTLNGIPRQIGGVAPNANLVSYRVCYAGDPVDPDDDGCQTSAIIRAIDQAIIDGVDIVNHSIGGEAHDPWLPWTSTYAFLNLREAGIFVATATGNDGPNPGTVGSPENAPWITSIGAATHDRVFASILENLSGGDTTSPGTLIGLSSTGGIGITPIVYAGDYGNALCATGTSESGATCDDNTGASSPFAPNTFNGEIVVCDRDTQYGRVERGKNLLLAGAGGYILADTATSVQGPVLDDLCLPSTHIDREDGDKLRTWLASGSGHQGSITGFGIFDIPEAGDVLGSFSARGPNLPPVAGVMKPDLIAPGVQILGATDAANANDYTFHDGTSFSSPHVAGGAALLKAIHPDWSPTMIASALVMTSTPEQVIDFDGSEANIHKRGAGRARLDVAVNAGLYLDETDLNFKLADPEFGGEPKTLNLPGLIDTACAVSCSFERTVTDMAGGATWAASAEGFAAGVSVNVTPNNFTLSDDASQELTVTVDLGSADIGQWYYGQIRLASAGLPDAVFPLAVYASGGELPYEWIINSNSISGWQEFALDDLAEMPDATFTSGGLVEPTITVEDLPQDISDSPYDSSTDVMTVWHNVPPETLWLHAETLMSTIVDDLDLDLYVGLDSNKNGIAEESEEICSSYTPDEVEFCDLFTPVAGDYWILVQNWVDSPNYDPNRTDEATLKSAVVGKNTNSRLTATGDGIVPVGETQPVRLSWDNVGAVPGTELMGAVGVGTHRDKPNNIGIIPVMFNKTSVAAPETLVLMNGVPRGLTVSTFGTHDRLFVDIPPGTDSFTISASVQGSDTGLNDLLDMELYRDDFNDAFTDAPFIAAPDTSGGPLASASGSAGQGPTITVSGGNAVPGRWYVVLKNTNTTEANVEIQADMTFSGTPVPLRAGLWEPTSRPGINQGFDYSKTGGYRAFLWYTYDEEGSPAWYLASGLEPEGNVWVAQLYRFTNDGTYQHEVPVGYVSMTTLAEQDTVFSFVLFGEEGSDRMVPSSRQECPTVNDTLTSYTGIWSRAADGVGGASVLANSVGQGYLHYIYDDRGRPVWLLGAGVVEGLPDMREIPLSQYDGYCAVCSGNVPTSQEVGVLTGEYTDEANVTWTLNYALEVPLSGSINRTDDAAKLTVPLICQ